MTLPPLTLPPSPIHAGCFAGTCLTCKATVPGYSAPFLDPDDVAPAAPSEATLPSPVSTPPRPESGSRILVGVRPHGKHRLTLLAVLSRLRAGQSVVWATTAQGETQDKLRALLAAEGATQAELARFIVWNAEDGE